LYGQGELYFTCTVRRGPLSGGVDPMCPTVLENLDTLTASQNVSQYAQPSYP
jgi:hypothetical protein